ncbi:MAG: isoprenylcysteine carboxylmethyltransferase family protein [Acidobacteria bacterium]|nr:isoprenylcysteine carboxylmethyltransferase family protein [Acidobacteriota bacterium]MBI3426822.1 isoprenylcysteine carboxylmethyltransferase family protein [Acidobacteriota bacterium]
MTFFKTFLFTLLVPCTVTIWIPARLLAAEQLRSGGQFGVLRAGGLLLMCLGAAIYLQCAWDFTFTGKGTPAPIDPPKELVARGLYRYTRNPMYVGVLSVLLGEAWWWAAKELLAYAALVALLFYCFVILYEEPVLRRQFGAAYEKYCQTVPRWLGRRRV